MKKNAILLIGGVILSLLFIMLSNDIYPELICPFYNADFDNEMYDGGFYFETAAIGVFLAWAFAAVFYYLVNSVSFSRWYHWLIVLGVNSVVLALASYFLPDATFYDNGFDFGGQLFRFSLLNIVVGAVLFVISSFSIRWWSSNCRHTPIPE